MSAVLLVAWLIVQLVAQLIEYLICSLLSSLSTSSSRCSVHCCTLISACLLVTLLIALIIVFLSSSLVVLGAWYIVAPLDSRWALITQVWFLDLHLMLILFGLSGTLLALLVGQDL